MLILWVISPVGGPWSCMSWKLQSCTISRCRGMLWFWKLWGYFSSGLSSSWPSSYTCFSILPLTDEASLNLTFQDLLWCLWLLSYFLSRFLWSSSIVLLVGNVTVTICLRPYLNNELGRYGVHGLLEICLPLPAVCLYLPQLNYSINYSLGTLRPYHQITMFVGVVACWSKEDLWA